MLSTIGSTYAEMGEKQKALDYYAQALPLWRAVKDRGGEASTLGNIGVVYLALGENQKALDFHTQALPLWRAAGDRYGETKALSNIAYTERSLGRLNESRTHIEECLKIRELLRTKVVSPELRASFFATVQEGYKLYVELLMQLHRQEPGKNLQAMALQVSERGLLPRLVVLVSNLTATL